MFYRQWQYSQHKRLKPMPFFKMKNEAAMSGRQHWRLFSQRLLK
jgi:hypothetical protein